MAITVDWGMRVITVPQADLTPVAGSLYELNVDTFRLTLKDLEDDEEGMAFPVTHRHNTEVVLGGVTYARVVEFINGYTVTFEDGQYAVRLVGGNNNLADVMNLNQVSLRSANSAGLIVAGSGLDSGQDMRLKELHEIHGLEAGSPLTVTPTQRVAAAVNQRIDESSGVVTVERI